MKKLKVLAALLPVLFLLASCGGRDMFADKAGAPPAPGGDDKPLYDSDGLSGGYAGEYLLAGAAGTEAASERKIVRNASLDIEADDADGLHARLSARAAELGGYEYANEVSHYESYSVVWATFKVPPGRLQDFLAYAGEEGRIINRRLVSDDVTEEYYDAQLRLASARNSLTQYYKFMDEAETLDDVLNLQRIIDGIIADIEAFEGRLRMWDILTDMATVSVYIRQDNDPVKIEREINFSALTAGDMGYLIKSGLTVVCSGLLTALQWIAVIVLVTSPVWIPLMIVLLIVWRRWKKRRPAAMTAPMPSVMPAPMPSAMSGENNAGNGQT